MAVVVDYQETYTLTFGERAENHHGMQIIGTMATQGFTGQDLLAAQQWFQARHYPCQIYDISTLLPESYRTQAEPAYLLVAEQGLRTIMDPDLLYREQQTLEKDTKAFMYGRVVSKKARYNLCFADDYQAPQYEQGCGTIIPFNAVPYTNKLRQAWSEIIGPTAANLYGEGNYYYNPKECGIGYHGDAERRKVVAVRLGATLPLCYQWYYQGNPVGERGYLPINHGDIYIMSDKAVGYDWRKRQIMTLRHAAGSDKYITVSK